MSLLEFLSSVFGWIYFICWSLSFYPQSMLNFSRKSTSGTTVDFPLINCLGFLSYAISNYAFYYSPLIRAQYASRYHGLTPTVQFNDITFALHGLLLSIITTSQYLSPRIVGVIFVIFIVLSSPERSDPSGGGHGWVWLDAIYTISYVKLIVTLIKYTPQVLVNYRNKSTKGWSIVQILLDFRGGVLSIGQQGIDSWLQGDWSGITGTRSSLRWGM
ncbi:uncharacterized protein PODANS_2_3300 [Podospora anserina S mat+]|uniref:Podospora anserina S mat+ genomic DNA chromosome 2, supercontig 2 n=1 Tax=Podospora anserina (strain S / ATCC MYA-4624 / DSM 980 / FGSC 10383) TaxID=515849 RepID=B2B524_PODAN|nr:uncharacterized protein PODANS_2_3300 [Podospora anserina S mat+]CAP72899.1 unnamed protein product [Podospora anserina S mat+]